jgi:DNA-binding transcriptional LysR family regulator
MSRSKSFSKKETAFPTLALMSVIQALLVGEYLSFRRAATVLGVRQSAVSRRVRELEDELGVSLFERHHAGVRVTNAGARFLQEAPTALVQLDYAVKTAAAAGSGTVGRLSIGILSSIATGYLRELIRVYCSHHPDVDVQILEGPSADNIAAVRKRQLDVAFIVDTTDVKGCETIPLWVERMFVVLPEDHALRVRNEIEWTDLRNEHLILRQPERDPAFCERFTRRLRSRNRAADVQQLNVGRDTVMHLVGMGLGVSLTSEATIATPFPKVVFRPIDPIQCGVVGTQRQSSASTIPEPGACSIAERRRLPGAVSRRTVIESALGAMSSCPFTRIGLLARRLGLST